MKKIYYPRLSKIDLGSVRIGGPGLANCMFFASMAYIDAKKYNGIFLCPSWMKFSIGPYIRQERDKRVYSHLFTKSGKSGIIKVFYLLIAKIFGSINVYGPYDLAGYFTRLNDCHQLVKEYFISIEKPIILSKLNEKSFYSDKIAIHVRLGDYPENFRVPISWYCECIDAIKKCKPDQEFLVFSDGSDEELSDILSRENVKRVFYGNAYADMKAISMCKILIASDSTFSAWGAFLGDVPIIFAKRHFPSVYHGRVKEYVLSQSELKTFFDNNGRNLLNL